MLLPIRPSARTGPRAILVAVLALALGTACSTAGDSTQPVQDGGAESPASSPDEAGTSDTGGDQPDALADDDEPAPPQVEPPVEVDLDVALTLTTVATLRSPIAGAVGPDGTFYVAERAGTVHPLRSDGVGDAVVDITASTTTDGERGLLGLAFAADGSELYVSSTDLDGDTLISAYPVSADAAVDGTTSRTVFTLDQPRANHNGGDLHIGPDGALYIGMGDGGGAGDPQGAGQDLTTALGAMLRIDPTSGDPYTIPDDNPFLSDPEALDEIWLSGLRNPWRFSFDRDTGDLWIADVGQNAVEEINRIPAGAGAGANLGWNLREGTRGFAGPEPEGHWPPIHEYTHDGRCSVTGGYVYRGTAIPELYGVYLYTDLCDSTVRALHVTADGEVVDERALGIAGQQVVSFAQDAAGELYLLDFSGAVRRIDRT